MEFEFSWRDGSDFGVEPVIVTPVNPAETLNDQPPILLPAGLGVGETNIAAPKLSSGARADVTVMCTPSAACSAAGSFVTITPEASMVSVTWSAPARNNWRSWTVSRSYKAPPAD